MWKKNKNWNKNGLLFMVLFGILVMSWGNPVNAAEPEENGNDVVIYIEEYTNKARNAVIKTCSASLAISGDKATCNGTGSIYTSMASSVKITMYLQKSSNGTWSNVSSWSASDSSIVALGKTTSVSAGTYRVKVVCTAGGETITVYSTTKVK